MTAEKVGKIPNVTYLAMRKINLCKDDRKTVGEEAQNSGFLVLTFGIGHCFSQFFVYFIPKK